MASNRFKGFVGQSYTLRNQRFDCQRTINLYPEADETGFGKNAEISQLTRTPGLTQLIAGIGEEAYCLYTVAKTNKAFLVTDSGLYEIFGSSSSTGWYMTKKASFSPSSAVVMTDNTISLFITASGSGWTYNLANEILTVGIPVYISQWTLTNKSSSDVAALNTSIAPTTCAYIDGYVIFAISGSNTFYWTDLYDIRVEALNFATGEANPDTTVAIFNNNEDLWVFGQKTTEIWFNSGPTGESPNAVFMRRPGILIETGCAAALTICKTTQNKIMWLSRDDRGGPVVMQSEGFVPIRVSTFAVEQQWSTLSTAQIAAATAYTYTQDGHTFYVLNIPGVTSTWVFDCTTSVQLQQPTWHERQWTDAENNTVSRHRGQSHIYYQNKHIVADYETGAIYALDQDAYDDAGQVIVRKRITPHVSNDGKRIFYNWLQIDFRTGMGDNTTINPQVMLRYSNDGGNTWSNQISKSVGVIGSYISRVIFNQLGQSRDRVFEVSMSDPIDWALSGAAIEAEAGEY